MPKRNNRIKASDVFEHSDFVFSGKTNFDTAFPDIEEIEVAVTETDEPTFGIDKRVYGKENLGEYVNCSNPRCYDGGVSTGSIISEMRAKKATEVTTTKPCQGYEGSPKGRKRYRSCLHRFKVEVKIKYKSESDDSE